jgi:hypothetical protein
LKPQTAFYIWLYAGIFYTEISNIKKSPQLDSDVPKPLLGNSLPAVDQQRDNIKKVRFASKAAFML